MVRVEDKIKNIRELKNLTQEYMAEKLGITQAGYSKIESGATKISYSKLTAIAKILEVDIEDILAFDSQKYFNSFNNVKGSNNGSVTIKVEDGDVRQLYEDKIALLQKLLENTERELNRYRDRFGDI
jgi:transcriptional regulator with XRE-family HTH domain